VQSFGDVSLEVANYIAAAEIHRPPHNFFDAGLIASLADAYDAADRAGARAIVLCSEGKNFCAGADFSGRPRVAGGGLADGGAWQLYEQAVRLFEAPLPVVAAVQGKAVGGGLGLACSADFRVISSQTVFTANFSRLSLHHGFGLTVTLPAIVGQQRAWQMLYSGRSYIAEEAMRFGLAEYESPHPRQVAREIAGWIAEAGPLAVRSIRTTMRGNLAARVKQAMDHERAEQEKLWQTADFAEGVKATAERRPPNFVGH
jgi:2-(1,2-epoxy-1,2-dihydrophenyl)acetyl-CoA isomerase